MKWTRTLITAAFALLVCGPVSAQVQTVRVQFDRGMSGTVINGTIVGDQAVDYILGAAAGQRMVVTLQTSNASNYFNVTGPGASAAMFIGSTSGNRFETVLPSGGDYRISVYLMRNAARRNESASYALSIQIVGRTTAAPQPPAPDYADGNAGGPDYWRVTGLSPGDRLNLRTGPSTQHAIVTQLALGQSVHNHGCQMLGGMSWCRVEVTNRGPSGWVAARYLSEGGPPVQRAPVYVPPPGAHQGYVPPRAGSAKTVRCSGTAQGCFSAAEQACRGSYQVVDSESHAGGILDDRFPGPVTWYSMTFRCGPSNGRRPTFAFVGPVVRPPVVVTPGHNKRNNKGHSKGVKVSDMQRYCQGEASAKFKQRPQNIATLPVERRPNGGRVVYGQFPPEGKKVKTFECHFDSDGEFKNVKRN